MRTRVDAGLLRTLLAAIGAVPLGCSGASESTGIPIVCNDPTPVVSDATGYVQCSNGYTYRSAIHDCPSSLPRAGPIGQDPTVDQCSSDSDCTERPNGYCSAGPSAGFAPPGTYCAYGCVTDAECGAGYICECGSPVGRCRQASCSSDGDCGAGLHCATYESSPGCSSIAYACQSRDDACSADRDCPEGQYCTISGGRRYCASPTCAIGRPFMVEGLPRVAPLISSSVWSGRFDASSTSSLSSEESARVGDFWAQAALFEHASVAAFARFQLQLLGLGAPADLVELTAQAMGDEIEHARLCFALASRYAGRSVGPGPLDVAGSLEAQSLEAIVELAIVEGCVGETVAALEAAEALVYARDPAVRGALERISADEARHAELAWRFVKWAIDTGGAPIAAVVERTFGQILGGSSRSKPHDPSPAELQLLEHGLMPEQLRQAVRAQALCNVIGPCAAAVTRPALDSGRLGGARQLRA